MTANWKQVLIENVWKILTLHLLKVTGETPEVRSDERRRKRKRRKRRKRGKRRKGKKKKEKRRKRRKKEREEREERVERSWSIMEHHGIEN